MIFISHNYQDKVVIEPIAIRLAEIFGRENVFYDSWSIQPGDGIIDKMSEGLEKFKHFFFFVSKNSLNSNMVKLEWQNAIYKASKGNCKVIPVRLDTTTMPAILSQSLYIDLYSNGIEVATAQMVNVIQGNSTFTQGNKFSNLSYSIEKQTTTDILLKISASHFLEPIPTFLILTNNKQNELKISLPGQGMFTGSFKENITLKEGITVNIHTIIAPRAITPSIPLQILIKKEKEIKIQLHGIMHQTGENVYSPIPMKK